MWNPDTLEEFLGEEVVDLHGQPIGTFACYWEREQKQALLLGVDTSERAGCTHVVPARGLSLNERHTYVQVPFERDTIVQAPCLECNREIDEDFERQVWDFYGLPVPNRVASSQRGSMSRTGQEPLRRIVSTATRALSPTSHPPSTGEEGDPTKPV